MNSSLDLYVERKLIIDRITRLTSGPITNNDQLQENLRELDAAIEKIERKQPVSSCGSRFSVRRYRNRFFSQKQ